MKKRRAVWTVLAASMLLCACRAPSSPTPDPTSTPTPTTAPTPTCAPMLGPYLGQEPPSLTPRIFAPGNVSDSRFFEYCGTFSPDGNEYYFNRFYEDSTSTLLVTKSIDGRWTAPEPCSFSDGYSASEPHLAFDDQRLYFMWKRTVQSGEPGYMEDAKYYFVERTSDGWSDPVYAGQGMFMTSSRDGQLYTTDMSSRKSDRRTYLAAVATENGVFTGYDRLEINPRFGFQAHPCIAPDGSYLLFDVNGGEYLYVSFRNSDGTWGEAIDLTEHGFDPSAGGACVSPDGKYLFFALDGDIWWVDIDVIERLRP